jgi:hypothetical protein
MAKMRQARHCAAHRTDGEPCGGWAVRGTTVCASHGGRAPQVQAAAQARLVVEQAAAQFGVDMDGTPPGEIALREVARSSAMVCHLGGLVSQLPADDLIWGVSGRRITPSATPGGTPQVQVEQRSRIHPWVQMLHRERDQLRAWLMAAHAAGVEERYVRLAEQDGAWAAKIAGALFARFVAAWQPTAQQQIEGRAIIAEVFRALERGELG